MRVLEEFWYGNINPVEIPFQRQRQFDKVFKLLTRNEEKLLETLNEQEKDLFDKYTACQDEITQITECQTFIKGFKLGARFVMACFENDDLYTERKSILIADITAFKPRNRAKDMQAGYLPLPAYFRVLFKNPARCVLFVQHRNKLVGRNLPFFILRACVLIKGDFFLNRR